MWLERTGGRTCFLPDKDLAMRRGISPTLAKLMGIRTGQVGGRSSREGSGEGIYSGQERCEYELVSF